MFKKSNALSTLKQKEKITNKQNKLLWLNVELIHDNPENDELYFSELHTKEFNALKEDIKEIGIKQPLLVKVHPHFPLEYIVISGHRRLAVAKELGLKQVPVMVEAIENEKDILRSKISLLTTNMLTRQRTPVEKAREIAKMKELILEGKKIDPDTYKGNTLDILAETLGVSLGQVKKYNKLSSVLENVSEEEIQNFEKEKTSYDKILETISDKHNEIDDPNTNYFEATLPFELEENDSFEESKSLNFSLNDEPKEIKTLDFSSPLPVTQKKEKTNPSLDKVQKILEFFLSEELREIDRLQLKVIQELVENLLSRS